MEWFSNRIKKGPVESNETRLLSKTAGRQECFVNGTKSMSPQSQPEMERRSKIGMLTELDRDLDRRYFLRSSSHDDYSTIWQSQR
ncbi:hypothetical protein ACXIUS_04845 [Bosea thiooxidans]